MTPMQHRSSPRAWLFASLLIAAALAGCATDTADEPEPEPDEPDEPTEPTEPEPPAEPSEPAPAGEDLTTVDMAALVTAFSDLPFRGGQDTPAHIMKWVSEDSFIFLHFDEADPLMATELVWLGVGVKGVFCEEAQPDPAFTHFHKWNSTTWEGGHGGAPGEQGYWLLHVGVGSSNGPAPGTDYNFGPTPPPTCGDGNVDEPDFTIEDEGGLDQAEIATLVAAFNDQPFLGGQDTPEHVSLWLNEDVFAFLHFNHADPLQATALNWYGIGVRGEACENKQPNEEFTHFHKWSSETWEGGHGGATGAYGYWLQHNAVRHIAEGPPWAPIDAGVDRNFMPTPVIGNC